MIARTRPNTDIKSAITYLKKRNVVASISNDTFYFSSGQLALEVFLKAIGGKKRIGIQVFSCPTVLQAIYSANDTPVYMDIDIDYFTSTIEYVLKVIDQIDVLILTHIFGIPNPDYLKIQEECKKRGIMIIDDLCQTYKAKINGSFLEDLSDNYFYSFFYDKPISCASGGMLKVSENLSQSVAQIINGMPRENNHKGRAKVRKLINMQQLLSPSVYKKECRNGNVVEDVIITYFPLTGNHKYLYMILASPINRFFAKFFPKYKYSKYKRRMSLFQENFIRQSYIFFNNKTDNLKSFFINNSYQLPNYLLNPAIECSCAQRAIVEKCYATLEDAEIELYNWPFLLDNCQEYPNANYVIKNFVNIPIL